MVNINGNWVKLFTKFTSWEWYKDRNTKDLFIHCLLKANWKTGRFEGVEIKRGSFATSLQTLMKELGMTKQEVRTALKHLMLTHELTQEQHNKFTVITIVNYELYQQANTLPNTELTQEQHSPNTLELEKVKNLTQLLTQLISNESLDIQSENSICEFLSNTLPNIELTQSFEKNAENQHQYKTIEYKNNIVCNNNARAKENFCHLGSEYKSEACFSCMKNNSCTLPTSAKFQLEHSNLTFEEWSAKQNLLYQQLLNQKKEVRQENIEILNYNWLEEGEKQSNENSF